MVNHHGESNCEVLPPKAMPRTSTDHMQGLDAFSTPKLAPATPMQAWQKHSHRQDSPDTLPSLSLGRSSTEMKAAYVNLNTKCGLASTPSTLYRRGEPEIKREETQQLQKENFLSFSLSQYEKNFDMAAPLRNHMGPASSHRVCAPAGDSKMLSNGGSNASPQEGHVASNGVVADESPPHSPMLSNKFEQAPSDEETTCKSGERASLFSPVPGEVANDAFKLYSELFPSASTTTAMCLSSSSGLDAHPNSFFGQMGSTQTLPADFCGEKSQAWDRSILDDAQPESGKRLKLSASEEGAMSKRLLVPKQEPAFEEMNGPKSFSFVKSSHMQPKNLAMPLSKAFDYVAHAGNGSLDMKPTVGLNLFTQSENAHVTASSSTLVGGEPSRSLASSKVEAWETPLQCISSMDADWGKFLALSATPSGKTDSEIMLPFQERFKKLQAFLKQCDEADQNERLQGLRSLSAAARSGYAVELETRVARLSLEEGKELTRMRLLNLLGRASESTLEEVGATPHGPRLPVPGASASPVTHAP